MTISRVRIVITPAESKWILGKIATRLVTHLSQMGVDADQGPYPLETADVNHWIYFQCYDPAPRAGIHTLMVTHVDGLGKLRHLKRSLEFATAGVCFSTPTRDMLVARGLSGSRLSVIPPGHDRVIAPKRIRLGITTRLYADGRKGESKLRATARAMRLDAFHFDIIGSGWREIIPELERSGATVRNFEGTGAAELDYQTYAEWIPQFDYYLYLGEDEGSMGTLDALAAGVKTIVTPQGFHLDLANGITHPVWTAADLTHVLRGIEADRRRMVDSVGSLTWSNYAANHLQLWNDLKSRRPLTEMASSRREADQGLLRERYGFYVRPYLRQIRMLYRRARNGPAKS